MTDEEQQKLAREVVARYKAKMRDVRKEFKKEIGEIMGDIRKRKLEELERKLGIRK